MFKKTIVWLAIILIVSALLGSSVLTHGHFWGDDFAAYIMQARSILNGNMEGFIEHNTITITQSSTQLGPIAYPWGYPLILAPVYALTGLSPLGLKTPDVIFYLAFLIVLFLLMRRRVTQIESLLTVSLFAFNPMFLLFLDYIISDIPFLFFSTLSLYLLDLKFSSKKQNSAIQSIAIGVIFFAAYFVRTMGIILLASFFLYQGIQFLRNNQRIWLIKDALVVALSFGILWAITSLIFPNGQGSYFAQYAAFTRETIWHNFTSYGSELSKFFIGVPLPTFIYASFLVFFLIGIWKRTEADSFFVLFMSLYFGLLLTWPEWQGIRFLFPLLPLFIYFSVRGMKFIGSQLVKGEQAFVYTTLGLVSLLFLSSATMDAYNNLAGGRAINGPFDQYSMEMYDFIKNETPKNSVIVFFKPRALRLMTDRDAISVTQCDQLSRGDYIALSKKVEDNLQIPPEEIEACGLPLEAVFQNRRFIVYKIFRFP